MRGIFPPFGCWDFGRAETWRQSAVHARYDYGCSGEEGECWNAGEAVLEISPVHAQTGHQPGRKDVPPRPHFIQGLLGVDPLDGRSCGGLVLTLDSKS